jgi:DNA-binding winged helix-turn-helix (wHTH) protein
MVYRFGEHMLDPGTRQLLRGAEELHLTPKAFELLHLLLENRGRAMAKAELQERMWPSTFVEETNLPSLIAEIRRALGDSATNPRFIGTVYGFGYRFIGNVSGEAGPSKFWLTFGARHFPLAEGENVIGRAPDAQIFIDAPSISRQHARVIVTNGEASLEDAGSKNGTQLNGKRLTEPAVLRDGDEIRAGAIALTFRVMSAVAPTMTLPHGG